MMCVFYQKAHNPLIVSGVIYGFAPCCAAEKAPATTHVITYAA